MKQHNIGTALKFAFIAVVSLVSTTVSAGHGHAARTITEIVASSGGEFDRKRYDYDILLNAVLAAGLQDSLADPNANLTVFAPNDRAFIRLARDLGFSGWSEAGAFEFIVAALTELGDGDPIPVLTNILLYHVSPEAKSLRTVLHAEVIDTLLTDAQIVSASRRLLDNDPDFKNPRLLYFGSNIKASNGIIHTINRVLIPADIPNAKPSETIGEIVAASGGSFDHNRWDYDILLNALITAGLDSALIDPDADVTVFAPNDMAFVRLARDLGFRGWNEAHAFNFIVAALTELGDGDPVPLLTNVLLYHVSPSTQVLKDVILADDITTLLEGATFATKGRILVDNDPVLRDPRLWVKASDIRASNGIIHTISRVLIPLAIGSDTKH